jgi:hypothetical protein
VLLLAVRQAGIGSPWSKIEPQLTGKGPAPSATDPGSAAFVHAGLRPRRSIPALREFLGPVVSAGLLARATRHTKGAYPRAYEAYSLTQQGEAALHKEDKLKLVLPVPAAARALEEQEAAKLEENKAALAKHGMLDKVSFSFLILLFFLRIREKQAAPLLFATVPPLTSPTPAHTRLAPCLQTTSSLAKPAPPPAPLDTPSLPLSPLSLHPPLPFLASSRRSPPPSCAPAPTSPRAPCCAPCSTGSARSTNTARGAQPERHAPPGWRNCTRSCRRGGSSR